MAELPLVAAVILAAVLVPSVSWTAGRTRKARRHFRQMQAAAHHPSRRLVEVVRPLRRVATGQLLLVIDVRNGQAATVWLSTPVLAPGDLALLVWMDGGWVLMDRLAARRLRRAATASWRLSGGTSPSAILDRHGAVALEAERNHPRCMRSVGMWGSRAFNGPARVRARCAVVMGHVLRTGLICAGGYPQVRRAASWMSELARRFAS